MGSVFDAEFDGLNPTKVHCLCADGVEITDYDEMRAFLLGSDSLIGHNIIRYDVPNLERLLGIKINAELIDTLALSWYLEPDRLQHGLEQWGEFFGRPKPKIDDWENLSVEEYVHRCSEDVEINTRLWERQQRQLRKLYGSDEESGKLVDYLMFKMDCAAEQERSRWLLDVDRCMEGKSKLEEDYDHRYKELAKAMPRVPVIAKRTKPKKPYKMDGSLSATGQRWFGLLERHELPVDYSGIVNEVVGHKDPNPSSVPQIKDWLFSMGWEPRNYKHVRNKETNEFKRIPQIKNEEGDGLCPSVLSLPCDALQHLDGMSVIQHRLGILKGFLGSVDDEGYVQAQIQGITNTLRFKHKVVVNLPSVDKPYGDLIRGCLTAPRGYELAGSDMSGLEDRTKQHYMWDYDPEYVKEMLTDDFDPHLDIGVVAGMIDAEDAQAYKDGDKEVKERLRPVRHDAKQVNYSCTYGVTPEGLVRNTGWGLGKAKKMHQTYWKRNWALQKIADSCVTKTCGGIKWLYNPVSQLWYSLRHEKDRFSTLNQGTGTYCFDMWVKNFRKKRGQLSGQMHDEVILCIKKGSRDKCIKLLKEAIIETNTQLGLNRELDVDVQFGNTYAEIH